jgi:hypothetical protein
VREFDAKFVLLFPFRHIFVIIIINRELPLRIISRGTRRRRRRIETRRDRENTTNNIAGAFLS